MARRDLRIYVSADTRGTVRATTAATKSFGALKGAAVAAGGAMAAGLAVGAKKAFDEFREAEKVTNQTTAALKSTGGAAKVTAREVENLAAKISLKAGIDDEAIQSGQNLLLTFTKLRNEAGKGNDIFNQATRTIVDMSVALDQDLKSSAIQVGKALNDPITGMTALRRVGVSFTQQQQERVKGWVEEGKLLKAQKFILRELTTEFGGSAAAQADASDKLKVAFDNVFESIGKAFGPALQRGAARLAKFIRQMQTGKGAGGEFADALGDVWEAAKDIGGALGPPLKAVGEFALKHKTVTAMAVALGLFAKGWAGLRGGGPGRLGGLGQAVGAMRPIPVFVTNPGFGGAGGGAGGGRGPAGGRGGRPPRVPGFLGPASALWAGTFGLSAVGPDPGRDAFAPGGRANRNIVVAGGKGGGGALAAQELAQDAKRWSEWRDHVRKRLGEVDDAQRRHVAASRQAFHAAGERLADLRKKTATETERIKDRLGDNTAKGRDALKRNYREAADAAKRQMDRAGVVTRQGTELIRDLFVKELRLYGIDAGEARRAVGQGGTRSDTFYLLGHQAGGKVGRGGRRVAAKRNMGGMVVPGHGQGDKVLMQAMVEPNEQVFVLNRNASAALRALQAWNSEIPRFQGGGILELLHPGNDPAHQDHLHLAMGNQRRLVALGRRLQRMGWLVGEHPAFGGVQGGHAPGSFHYSGRAIDVNWPDAGQERSKIAGLLPMLTGLTRAAKVIRAPRVGGRGPIRDILQQGLSRAARAANRRIGALLDVEGAESVAAGGSSAANMQIGRRLARAYGWGSGPNWSALVELWNRESGWNNLARNPSSGAFGIPQALPPSKMPAAAQRGDARSQILWGLRYISGRYGSPAAALSFHNANNWYRRGGLVRLQRGGTARRHPRGLPDPDTLRRVRRQRRRQRRQERRQIRLRGRRMPTPGAAGSALGEVFAWRANQFAAGAALAALTETTADDLAAAEQEAAFWESWLPVAQASGDPAAVTTAAQGLASARDTIAGLRGQAAQSQEDLVAATKELTDAINRQTQFASSVAGIGQATALKAFADVISGQIAGYAGQRGRSAGDGVTGFRL